MIKQSKTAGTSFFPITISCQSFVKIYKIYENKQIFRLYDLKQLPVTPCLLFLTLRFSFLQDLDFLFQ